MRNQSELQKDTTKEQAQQWDEGKEERTDNLSGGKKNKRRKHKLGQDMTRGRETSKSNSKHRSTLKNQTAIQQLRPFIVKHEINQKLKTVLQEIIDF